MAYNNGFPVTYQQMYYQPNMYQPQNVQQNQQMFSPPTIHAEIIQVDGEQAAVNYPVAAGASQMMIAKDDSAIYIKTAFANGQHNLDVYVKRPPEPRREEFDPGKYVTYEELEKRLQSLVEPQKGKSALKEEKE